MYSFEQGRRSEIVHAILIRHLESRDLDVGNLEKSNCLGRPPPPRLHRLSCGPFSEYVRSHGTKNTLLDGKRRSVTLKTKDFSFLKDVISLFLLPLCITCHPAWRFLHHVTLFCKCSHFERTKKN